MLVPNVNGSHVELEVSSAHLILDKTLVLNSDQALDLAKKLTHAARHLNDKPAG